jgi:hypothetical protein
VKAKLVTLGFVAILGAVILTGCGSTAAQPGDSEKVQGEDCRDADTGATLSYQEAADIAQESECLEQGQLKEMHFCNEGTGTWWIDLDIDKPGCAPACVVNVSDRTAEINWRCTGLVPPTSDEAAQYEVTVQFNTSATQDDLSETEAVLKTYDDAVDYVVMESFPPVGRALLATEEPDFCQTVEAELEAASYIDGATCEPWVDSGEADPDAPVSSGD